MRPATIAAVTAVLVVGFAIGGWLAFVTRPSGHATSVATTTTNRTSDVVQTAVPVVAATDAPTPKPAATPVPAPKPLPTQAPTAKPLVTPVPTPRPAPRVTVATTAPAGANPAVAARSVPAGTWELDEANTQVGTIVWTADVASAPGNMFVLNAHKQSVGGRPAVPCERQTSLHAEFPTGAAVQIVPYREVNCEGIASTGELRISSVPGNGGSFSGSFWRSGVKLGDFSARRR